MTLHGDVRSLAENDGVRFVFEVTNDGESTEEITFQDAGKADFVVERAAEDNLDGEKSDDERKGRKDESSGEEHWRWSEGRMFAQVIETERLDPGESSTYEGEWRSPDAGRYVARAALRTRDRDLEATCEFSVDG